MKRATSNGGAVFLGLLLVGCGGSADSARLTGQVSLDGKAVEAGSIQVVSEDGKAHDTAIIGKEGKYEFSKAPLGKVKLAILVPLEGELAPPPPPAALKKVQLDNKESLPEDLKLAIKMAQKIPKAYMNARTSGIGTTVQPGDNTMNVELTTKFRGPG